MIDQVSLNKEMPETEKNSEISAKIETMLIVRFLGGTAPKEKRARAEAALYISQWFDLDTDLLIRLCVFFHHLLTF
jgi:hypothetical protein